MKGCMIAGTSSNSGKTTVCMGLLAALKEKGMQAAPFKAGPDYIDSGYHQLISGRPCINLDAWICGEGNLPQLFSRYSEGCDIGIVEGVMGLFDGMDTDSIYCSSAHVANSIGLPVILVLDGSGVSLSAAAVVKGFKDFALGTNIAGVIFNRVSGEGHFRLLKKAVETHTGVRCIGYLPAMQDFRIPDRHLGLVPACEAENLAGLADKLAKSVLEHIDLDLLLSLCTETPRTELPAGIQNFMALGGRKFAGKSIGVAIDEAFNFYYRPNLDLLEMVGADLVPFSPLRDAAPPAVDALYIGGGFPEVFAGELEVNTPFRMTLKDMLEAGTPCYAECGGLMYLCEGMEDMEGNKRRMAGFFPQTVFMTQALQRFGYVNVHTLGGNNIHAHEFHYSVLEGDQQDTYFEVARPDGSQSWRCGLHKKNTIAGYPHLHFWDNPEVMEEVFGER